MHASGLIAIALPKFGQNKTFQKLNAQVARITYICYAFGELLHNCRKQMKDDQFNQNHRAVRSKMEEAVLHLVDPRVSSLPAVDTILEESARMFRIWSAAQRRLLQG